MERACRLTIRNADLRLQLNGVLHDSKPSAIVKLKSGNATPNSLNTGSSFLRSCNVGDTRSSVKPCILILLLTLHLCSVQAFIGRPTGRMQGSAIRSLPYGCNLCQITPTPCFRKAIKFRLGRQSSVYSRSATLRTTRCDDSPSRRPR
jgi:hypothetical protein